MTKVSMKGELVSPMYDCEFFAEWIDKGIICPSSRILDALDRATDMDDVSVFVDTPGGDVFAGDSIIISALEAKKRCASFEVEIGSEACSMGANFIAALKAAGAKTKCHANSKVMFHSAFVDAEGGADKLRDRAELVDQINASVKANLAALGIEGVDEWFAEGREKWLCAEDLKKCGLVDEVIEAEADSVDITEGVKSFRAAALKREEAAAAKVDAKVEAEPVPVIVPTAEHAEAHETDWESRFKGASRKINELTAERDALQARVNELTADAEATRKSVTEEFETKHEADAKALAEATAKVSELSGALAEMQKTLDAKANALGEITDRLAVANEQVERLEAARQLLTAGVLTPAKQGESYADKMKSARTPEEREALRAKKRAGKIN